MGIIVKVKGMSDFFQEVKIKHTRKQRCCDLCLRKIPEGFSAWNLKGVYEGEFFSSYFCNTCKTLSDEFYEYVTDGWCNCYDPQVLQDNINDYECATPLQLLNKLREREKRK